jgi:hypothetical protein
MPDRTDFIATFLLEQPREFDSLEANEQHAIANYGYEQAQLIVESRQKRQRHPSIDKIDADYRAIQTGVGQTRAGISGIN